MENGIRDRMWGSKGANLYSHVVIALQQCKWKIRQIKMIYNVVVQRKMYAVAILIYLFYFYLLYFSHFHYVNIYVFLTTTTKAATKTLRCDERYLLSHFCVTKLLIISFYVLPSTHPSIQPPTTVFPFYPFLSAPHKYIHERNIFDQFYSFL